MKKNKPLCSSRLHFFEDKNRQSSHFFEDNSLYTVLDSKSAPRKIHHPSIKYPTNIAIFASNKVSKGTSYKGSKTGTLDTSKARKSSKSNRNSIIQAKTKT